MQAVYALLSLLTSSFSLQVSRIKGSVAESAGSVWLQQRRRGFNPWVERSPGEGKGNPLQYFCLKNSMDRGAWLATVHGVTKKGAWLGDLHFHCTWSNYLLDFPGGSDSKASVSNVRDLGSIPGLGRFHGEGNGNPLQYSCLENPMDGGGWCRVLSVGLQRVGHDWATSLHCWYNFLKNVVDFLWMAQQYSPLQRSYIHNIFWDNPFSIFGSCWDDWGPNRFLEDL